MYLESTASRIFLGTCQFCQHFQILRLWITNQRLLSIKVQQKRNLLCEVLIAFPKLTPGFKIILTESRALIYCFCHLNLNRVPVYI